MERKEITRRFDYVPGESLSEEQVAACEAIRARIKGTAMKAIKLCPDGREQSLAITALEEALQWSIAAIVRPRDSSQD